jgi:putative ABC transport system permease protein
VLIAALRDLQWRRRRFAIAVVGAALVFAMTLLLTGLANGFTEEASRTERALGVDAWVVPEGASGPFLGATPVAEDTAGAIAATGGVDRAVGFAYARVSAGVDGDDDVNLFAVPPGGPGVPAPDAGRAPTRSGEVLASSTLDVGVGDELVLLGRPFTVVGVVDGSTSLGGVGNAFATLDDAQGLVFAGQPIAMAVATAGVPERVPAGLRVLTPAEARDDLLRPLRQPRLAVTVLALLLWVVAATIIGSVIYMTAIERVRDFAVFKAVGVPTRDIALGLVAQSVVLAVTAAVLGAVAGVLAAPSFPMLVDIPAVAFAALPLLAVAVGALASGISVRRATSVDPNTAFRGP